MARDVVSDKILLAYFARSIPAADQWMHFRKELAGQMALASFMSFVLCIGDRGPHKFSVSRSSARVQQLDFYHTYSDFYFTLNSDTVPFRLTRNITALLGPWLIDGVFAAGVTGAAACLARNQELMKNFLSLFHRDDLVMFHSSRVPLLSDSEQQRTELQLRDRIGTNVRQMLKRVHGLMPSQSSSGPTEDPPSPVNSKVLKLVESATDPALLANMPPTWQPWF
jgi:transformation/transcription domain-associated protein